MFYNELPLQKIMIFFSYTVWNYRRVFKRFWLFCRVNAKVLLSHLFHTF